MIETRRIYGPFPARHGSGSTFQRRGTGARPRLIQLLMFVMSLILASPAFADPSFSLDQTTATLPINSKTGSFNFGLSATGLDPRAKNELALSEFGPDGPIVKVAAVRVSTSGATALWKVSGTVDAFATSEAQARHLVLVLDGKSLPSLAYTIKNTAPGDFTWSVSGLTEKRLSSLTDDQKFVVQIGNVPAHNVRLVQSDLLAADNLTPLPTTFKLCRADHPDDCNLTTLAAGGSYPLLLRAQETSKAAAGQYGGTLLLVADESPLGTSLPIHVVVSSACARWFGLFLICLGVALALAINPFARAVVARKDALRPAVVLRERAADWSARLAEVQDEITKLAPANIPALDGAAGLISAVETSLATTALDKDRLIPSGFAAFYTSTAATAAYQALLATNANRLGALALVVEKGIRPALAVDNAATLPDLVAAAIVDLDGLLANPNVVPNDDLFKKIGDRLTKLNADIAAELKANTALGFVDPPTLAPMREPTLRQLDFEVGALNILGWLFFAISSILVGSLVLLLMNPAFGSIQDYVICVLWGFGIPSAGAQLTTLGQGSIASSLGVKLLA